MAIAVGTEARAKHNQAVRAGRRDIMEGLDFWSPNVNIFRDPRWGRGQETYGEDPFLTGRMGIAFVTGLQGDDPKYFRVIATPKHFAVHSGPEPSRHTINIEVSKHDMEDTYLPAFRAAVTEGKAASVMCAYNRVNGQPACANDFLLKGQLRAAWHFEGYVVSDCDAIVDIFQGHKFTHSRAEAAAVAMRTGMDNECADFFTRAIDDSDYAPFIDAVKQGLMSEKDLDVALKRLFTARFRLGMFDPPEIVRYAQTPDSEIDSEAHRALALRAARESMVLLKNNGVLPFSAGIGKIAVVGPLAESVSVLHGNYSGTASHATTALEGIRNQFPGQVTFAPGMNFLRTPTVVPSAVLSAEDGSPGLKGEYFASENFAGAPQMVRVDKFVDLQLVRPQASALTPPENMKNFSVRWQGFLIPREAGSYQIGLEGSGNRLWINGELVVDDLALHDPAVSAKTLPLEKGRRYAVKVEYARGAFGTKLVWLNLIADPIAEAVAAAKQADVVVAVVGITSQLEGEEMKVEVPGFKGGDRTSLDLPKEEEDLLEAIKNTGKRLVVVLMNGSALSVNWASEHADAILDAWYAGEEGGTAIAQTLAGTNNPAGRLPLTFYKGVEQLPPFEDYGMKNRTYRYFDGGPLYRFGYGLSYSKFEYSNIKLSPARLKAGGTLDVDVDVKNTSPVEGDEVVQLYVNFPKLSGAPIRALRGFTRVHVASSASQHVHFTMKARDLSMVEDAGNTVVAAGDYTISVGGGQPGESTAGEKALLAIEGNERLPD
jgi:beta-glucosidase